MPGSAWHAGQLNLTLNQPGVAKVDSMRASYRTSQCPRISCRQPRRGSAALIGRQLHGFPSVINRSRRAADLQADPFAICRSSTRSGNREPEDITGLRIKRGFAHCRGRWLSQEAKCSSPYASLGITWLDRLHGTCDCSTSGCHCSRENQAIQQKHGQTNPNKLSVTTCAGPVTVGIRALCPVHGTRAGRALQHCAHHRMPLLAGDRLQ